MHVDTSDIVFALRQKNDTEFQLSQVPTEHNRFKRRTSETSSSRKEK